MKKRRPGSQSFRRDVFQDGANDGAVRKDDPRRWCLPQDGRQASFLTQGRDEAEPRTHAEQGDRFATTQPCVTKIFHRYALQLRPLLLNLLIRAIDQPADASFSS